MSTFRACFTFICLILSTHSVFGLDRANGIKRSFQSDQCTFWPDSSFSHDWSHCCEQHDLFYWAGGTESERQRVDHELKVCITESSGRLNAALMNLGVRLGSYSPLKFPGKQWGNAWGDDVRRSALDSNEIKQLQEDLLTTLDHNLSHSQIDSFIEQLRQR